MTTAKDKSKNVALELYLNTGMTQADIAAKVGVSARTIGTWARKGEWEKKAALRQATPQEVETDLLTILSGLNKKYLAEEDATERVKLSDQVSKFNKALENLRKDKRMSLTQIIGVLKELLSFAEVHMPKITPMLTELEEKYVRTKSEEYL
jgi:transposase